MSRLSAGHVIADRFELERRGRRGGMGAIFRARDHHSGQPVAIKLLRAEVGSAAERFGREGRILGELTHPGIVRYVAHGAMPSGALYLAMEWLEGEDLGQRLRRGPLTVLESLELGRRVAGALAFAHDHGVVHRDLKPSNLFLVESAVEQVKVVDFGLARSLREAEAMTRTGMVVGTPGYMAPEQARGARHFDARVDVFSLGTVLYECLSGRAAFSGDNPMAIMAKIVLDDVEPLQLGEELPAGLEGLLMHMLAKSAIDRPTAEVVVAELSGLAERALPGAGPRARAPGLTHGEQRLVSLVMVPGPDVGTGQGLADGSAAAVDSSDLVPQAQPTFAGVPTLTLEPAAPAPLEPLDPLDPLLELLDPSLSFGPDADLGLGLEAGEPTVADPQAAAAASPTPPTSTAPLGRLPAHLERARTVVGKMGGHLETLADGSLVAVVSRGLSPTDDATQAARCALAFGRLYPWARVALATGRGLLSARLPVGEAIDRATLLCRGGQPGVHLDELSASLVGERFDTESDGGQLRLLRERGATEDLGRTVLGRPTPCVGRDRELGTLESVFDECAGEPVARAVLVRAPAGAGKSRLRRDLLRRLRLRDQPVEIWRGNGDPLKAGSPFGLIAAALRDAVGLSGGEPLGQSQQRLELRLARSVGPEALARVMAFVGEVVGIPFATGTCPELAAARENATVMGDQIRRAWLELLAAECSRHPVVLVLEDLHHGDLPSVALVDAALRALGDRPFMVLALGRPEVEELFPRLWQGRGVLQLDLPPLTRRACEKLVRHLLGPQLAAATVDRLVAQAAGNAFYLEELIRAVAEGREDLPETILAMLEARLVALPTEARRALRAASVLGQVFWDGALRSLVGEADAPTLDTWLEELVRLELIRPREQSRFVNEREYHFRQGLLREAAYGMLVGPDRVLGHRLAADWLERAGETEPLVLAEHCERGGEPGRAAQWYVQAAEQALRGSDFATTLGRLEQALACEASSALTDHQPAPELRGRLRRIQAEALHWQNDLQAAETAALEAVELLPRGSVEFYRAHDVLIQASAALGHVERLERLSITFAAVVPDGQVRGSCLATGSLLAFRLRQLGRRQLGRTLFVHMRRLAAQVPENDAGQAFFRAVGAWEALFAGELLAYLEGLEEAAPSFEAAGDHRNACMMWIAAGQASAELGRPERGVEILRRALVEVTRLDLELAISTARHNLGYVLWRAGELEEAESLERQAALAFATVGSVRLEGLSRAYLAAILLDRGSLEAAETEARRAVELLDVAPLHRPRALATLARVLLGRGQPGEALERARQARAALPAHGEGTDGESLVRLVLVEALVASGHRQPAAIAAAEAEAFVLERARRIGPDEWRRSFLDRIAEHRRTRELAAELGAAAAGQLDSNALWA